MHSENQVAANWAPDLKKGQIDPNTGQPANSPTLTLDFSAAGNSCAEPAVFHTCIGSNKCKAQGGCGFVQKISGGGNCGFSFAYSSARSQRFKCGG